MKKAKMLVTSAVAALTIGATSIAAFAAVKSIGFVYVNDVRVDGSISRLNSMKFASATTSSDSAMDFITSTAILRYNDGGTKRSVSSTNTEVNATYCNTTAFTIFGVGYGATGYHEAEHNHDNKIFVTYLDY